MPIVIGNGINIGGGINIDFQVNSLRGLLSPAGQASYDSAATDGWFSVDASDYVNVRAGLNGVTTVGFTDDQLLNAGTPFSQNFGATVDQANAAVSTGNYVLGLASRTASGGSGSLVFRPWISTTFRGTYVAFGVGNLTMNLAATRFYWLRKNPPTPVASTSYVALGVPNAGSTLGWGAGTASGGTWGSGSTGGAYSSGVSSWTSFNATIPAQQWVLTNVRQW